MYVQRPMFYLGGALALVFVACASPAGPAASPAEARDPGAGAELAEPPAGALAEGSHDGEERLALGRIELQNHIVTMYSGNDGPRFGIAARDGRAIVEEITRDEFQSRYPALFRSFETARAQTDASLSPSEMPGKRGGAEGWAP